MYNVSIHAPTRGATEKRLFAKTNRSVSIHAPTRGATKMKDLFNSEQLEALVSIHAPTRGATGRTKPASSASESFNPRTHTGCDSVQSYIL